MIASPPVQPSCSITSGTGSVSTMWLEETVRRSRSRRTWPEAALIATAAAPARTRPPAVSATTPPARVDVQRRHPRVLEDPHAAPEQALAQPERQPRGLDRRARGRHHAAAEHRRVAHRARLLPRERQHLAPVDARWRWRRPGPARRTRRGAAPRATRRRPPAPRTRRPPSSPSPPRRRTARAPAPRRTARPSAASSATARRGSRRCARSGPCRSAPPRAPPRARSARARAPPTPSTCPCSRRR